MSNDFAINVRTLLEQCGDSNEIALIVLEEFLVQIAADIQELESYLSGGDLAQVGKVGHRLKGTAGVLGAEKLQSICFSLETAGKNENAEELAKFFIELKAEADRCIAAVPEARMQL